MPFGGSVSQDVPPSPLSLFWELLCFPGLASVDIPYLVSERIQIMCRETDSREVGLAVDSVLGGTQAVLFSKVCFGQSCERDFLEQILRYLFLMLFPIQYTGMGVR